MRFNSLDAWLDWQATLNPAEIVFGLDRIADVLQRMGLDNQFKCPLITVAGTNGKGSVVSMLESMASAAGLNVCCYTSPHIIAYNERIKVNGKNIDDDSLCQSFQRIDQARADVPLTYFEFGTLAAIDVFMRAEPDLVIMEIGLGGRLDAVNVMEPDVSVITSVAIDHTDWLGDNREAIAREKAGIMRSNRPTICGELDAPASLLEIAQQNQVEFYQLGQQFTVGSSANGWTLQSPFAVIQNLPEPALKGEFQKANAATAILALQALQADMGITHNHISQGLLNVHLSGRFEKLHDQPLVIVDVAHNPHAVKSLVAELQTQVIEGSTRIVIAMLADKPVDEVVALLSPITDYWYSAGLESEARGLSAQVMSDRIAAVLNKNELLAQSPADVKLRAELTVKSAIEAALREADSSDRIVVLGSFHTVAAAIDYFS
ncbi:MAG: bifunctional tetrahydrofolate synthase/dihydrofolate synthase [Gammaproteobacteria bacterium]|nr:bifunctional tetrahydrofolate synthase/dihydrofolate synthase [Gammaproteobacteria bacterium]